MADAITVELPWPHKALSPNSRSHWAVKAKKAKVQREASCVLTHESNRGRIRPPVVLSFRFYPPTNHSHDMDNLLARCKSTLDGISDALGIDDKRFVIGEMKVEPAVKHGKLIVTIREVAS